MSLSIQKTRPYTQAEVACGWAGAAKKLKKLSGTDGRTDGPTDRRTEWVIESRARDYKSIDKQTRLAGMSASNHLQKWLSTMLKGDERTKVWVERESRLKVERFARWANRLTKKLTIRHVFFVDVLWCN